MCQGFNHFPGFSHHFVLAKFATSSVLGLKLVIWLREKGRVKSTRTTPPPQPIKYLPRKIWLGMFGCSRLGLKEIFVLEKGRVKSTRITPAQQPIKYLPSSSPDCHFAHIGTPLGGRRQSGSINDSLGRAMDRI